MAYASKDQLAEDIKRFLMKEPDISYTAEEIFFAIDPAFETQPDVMPLAPSNAEVERLVIPYIECLEELGSDGLVEAGVIHGRLHYGWRLR